MGGLGLRTEIEEALAAVLGALLAARQEEQLRRAAQATADEPIKIWTAADLVGRLLLSRAQSQRINLASRPVTAALELAIRTLGQQAHDAGLDMAAIADAACEANPGNVGRCQSIVSHKWDGIGHWHA